MYRQRFGLTGHPLPKDAQGKTFFDQGPGYKKLQRAFRQLVEDPGLGVLTADAGVGKTAAIRNLCAQLPRPDHLVLYLCDTAVAPLDLYRTLATEIGVRPSHRRSQLWTDIKNALVHMVDERGTSPVLILDEAQHLSDPFLIDLSGFLNFAFDSRDLLTMWLVGLPPLARHLRMQQHAPLAMRVVYQVHLEPLESRPLPRHDQTRPAGRRSDRDPPRRPRSRTALPRQPRRTPGRLQPPAPGAARGARAQPDLHRRPHPGSRHRRVALGAGRDGMKPEDDSVLPVVRASEAGRTGAGAPLAHRPTLGPRGRWHHRRPHPSAARAGSGSTSPCRWPVAPHAWTPSTSPSPAARWSTWPKTQHPSSSRGSKGLCRHRGLELAALPIGVITAPSVRLDLPSDQRRLAATVRRHVPRLLLLDPFVRLHRINENQASDVAAVLGYLRELQRAHNLAVTVVHHARKNGGSASGGQSLRGSGDFFAWVDTALSLRRHRQRLVLSVEHRAAAAPEPSTLALAGTDNDMHLAIVAAESQGDPHTPPATTDLDATVLEALRRADNRGLPRASLRAALRVRNQRLGEALMRLTASGHIARHGDAWVRLSIPVPPTIDTPPEPERECGVTGG